MKNKVYRTIKKNESLQKNSRKGRISSKTAIETLAVAGNANNKLITIDCLKKANQLNKITGIEHASSMTLLYPFFEEFGRKNPGFKFELQKDPLTHEFERLAILFPYSVTAMNYCFKVFGVDTAFLDGYQIKYREKQMIGSIINNLNLPYKMKIMFKKCFLIGLSGRTLNNEMILFGFCICYAENIENYNFFFEFLTKNQVLY